MSTSRLYARRFSQAGLTFVLTLATATLLWNQGWNQGREFGREQALRPLPAPTATASSAFTKSPGIDASHKLALLQAKLPFARTVAQKRTLAKEFTSLALSAHFHNEGAGKLSLSAYDNALALLGEAGDSWEEAGAWMNRATTVALLGKPHEAEANLRRSREIYTTLPRSELQQAEVQFRLGEQLGIEGRYAEAKRCLDRSLGIRQQRAERVGEADCLSVLGQIAFEEEQYALARQLLTEAARIFATQGKTPSRAAVLGQLGDIELSEGEVVKAERLYAEGLAVWQKLDQGFWTGKFLVRQAKVALARNDLSEAARLAAEGREKLAASNGPVAQAGALLVLSEIAGREKRNDQAEHLRRDAETLYQTAGYAYGIAQCPPRGGQTVYGG